MKKKKPLSYAAILAKQKKAGRKPFNKKQLAEAASELGRMGGNAGGPARAKALTDDRRYEIAKRAADIRWGNIERQDENDA